MSNTTHRFGGYENLNLSQAEIAARAYNAGLPPSVRPLNASQAITWTPCRLIVGIVAVETGVAIDAGGLAVFRSPSGVITTNATVLTGFSVFQLAGGFGVGFFNLATRASMVAYTPGVLINIPVGAGKFMISQAIEHDYWDSNWGTNY